MSLGPPYIGIRVARSPGPGCKGIAPGEIETFLTLHTTDVAEKSYFDLYTFCNSCGAYLRGRKSVGLRSTKS